MKNTTLKLAVIGALIASAEVMAAAGFTAIPKTTPVAHPSGTGTTAYVVCNPTGNFGSGTSVKAPTTSPDNECLITPAPATDLTAPVTGYSIVTSANRTVTMNNTYTGSTNKNIGTLLDVVWRKPAATAPVTPTDMCIYGTKFTATNIDYNTTIAGTQTFEANGIARGGFVDSSSSTPRDVEVAYSRSSATAEVLFRSGRAFTSVQHRSTDTTTLPKTGLGSSPSINGLNSWPGNATGSQTLADLNDNWVEFTSDANANDGDGTTTASSAMFYIRTTCSTAAPVAVSNAIRLRQSFQELSGGTSSNQFFIEVPVTAFVPPNGAATPAPTSPF